MTQRFPLGRAPQERAELPRDLARQPSDLLVPRLLVPRRWSLMVGLLLAVLASVPATAGPNEDGMLVIHIDKNVVYSRVDCDLDLRDCAQAVTSIAADPDRVVVLFLLAAFPFSPSVKAVNFGIDYTATLVAQGSCQDLTIELPHEGWPDSGSGTALVFESIVTDRVFPVYWFAVYAEDGAYFAAAPHPFALTEFADDSIPAQSDEIEGFGWAGFGLTGYNPCLEGVPIGACCLSDGSCVVTTETACEIQEGVYRGDDEVCDPFSCVGPCCLNDECYEATQIDCERDGGEWGERPGAPCGQISCLRENVSWGVLKHHHRY
jgi:hypothetical protein